MKSGTEKNPNPHESSLSKFLFSLSKPVSSGYVLRLRTGQILRKSTWENRKIEALKQV